MVLHADKDINDEFIRDIVETLLKVTDTTLWMFFKHLEFRVLLVQLMSDCAADDIGEHRLECLLVAIIVLDGQHKA